MTNKTAEQAVGIAKSWLRHQPWRGRYVLYGTEVLDRGKHWWCVFKDTDWRHRSPGRGVVAVHKRTGKASWISVTNSSVLYD